MLYCSNACRGFFRPLICLFLDRFLVFYCASWCFIRYNRLEGNYIPYLNDWLTDFVFVPLVAHFSFVFGVFIFRPGIGYRFSFAQMLLVAVCSSISFEYVFPMYSDYNVADWADVAAYFGGALFYYGVHQGHTKKRLVGLARIIVSKDKRKLSGIA